MLHKMVSKVIYYYIILHYIINNYLTVVSKNICIKYGKHFIPNHIMSVPSKFQATYSQPYMIYMLNVIL